MEEKYSEIIGRAKLLPQILSGAKLYKANLSGTSLLIVFQEGKVVKYIEPHFWEANFMHLVGAESNTLTAADFYGHCIDNKLTVDDFTLTKYAPQKLEVLPALMDLTKKAKMMGDFNGQSKDLYTEKLAGGIYGCMGFIRNGNGIYVPNTVIGKNVKDLVNAPYQQILAIYQKPFSASFYPHEPKYICKGLKAKVDNLIWPEEIMIKILEEPAPSSQGH